MVKKECSIVLRSVYCYWLSRNCEVNVSNVLWMMSSNLTAYWNKAITNLKQHLINDPIDTIYVSQKLQLNDNIIGCLRIQLLCCVSSGNWCHIDGILLQCYSTYFSVIIPTKYITVLDLFSASYVKQIGA